MAGNKCDWLGRNWRNEWDSLYQWRNTHHLSDEDEGSGMRDNRWWRMNAARLLKWKYQLVQIRRPIAWETVKTLRVRDRSLYYKYSLILIQFRNLNSSNMYPRLNCEPNQVPTNKLGDFSTLTLFMSWVTELTLKSANVIIVPHRIIWSWYTLAIGG